MVKKPALQATKKSPNSGQKERFCRIDIEAELKSVAGTRFADNSYEGTFGNEGWGLVHLPYCCKLVVKTFVTKKQRRNGAPTAEAKIDSMGTRSIKYDSSDSD